MGREFNMRQVPAALNDGVANSHILSRKMGGIQTIDVRLAPAHAGWRLDRALADAVPTISRERLKALIRSGAVESQGFSRPRSCAQGQRRRSASPRRPGAKAPAQRAAGHSAQDPVRGRASPGRRQARRAGCPSRGRQSRRNARQRATAPLRGQSVGHRRGRAAGHRASDRQGHVGAARRRQDRCGARGPGKAVRGAFDRRRYLAIVGGVPKTGGGTIDAPLARSATNRKKIAIVEGQPRQAGRHSLEAARSPQRRGPCRMPARNRPHSPGPGAHGLDRPCACSATRSTDVPGKRTASC